MLRVTDRAQTAEPNARQCGKYQISQCRTHTTLEVLSKLECEADASGMCYLQAKVENFLSRILTLPNYSNNNLMVFFVRRIIPYLQATRFLGLSIKRCTAVSLGAEESPTFAALPRIYRQDEELLMAQSPI